MTYRLEFEIPGLPRMPNTLLGSHWRTRSGHASKWKGWVHMAVLAAGRPRKPLEHARVTLTRMSSVEPDDDGLRGSFKPILDGLVQCGVLVDDRPSVIGTPTARWEKCPPKQGKVRIVVEEVCTPEGERE